MAEMARNDSASIISSLQMDYGDSDDDDLNSSKDASRNEGSLTEAAKVPFTSDEKTDDHQDIKPETENMQEPAAENATIETSQEPAESGSTNEPKKDSEVSPVDFISDDEDQEAHPHHHHHHHHHHHNKKTSETLPVDRKRAVTEPVNTDSPSSQGSVSTKRKAMRLVSYGPDEDVDESSESEEEEPEVQENVANSPEAEPTDSAAFSRSVQNMASDDIKIPPEPPGRCPQELQDKIIDIYERMKKERLDLNRVIQNKKNFRNPSIYDKLVDFCHIDEKGTNFPPEIYDPHLWGKESFYDELDKAQRKDMERREKEKKDRTKIEFLTGTKKSSAPSSFEGQDDKKRKSKWDTQPAGMTAPLLKAPGVTNPGVVNLTATATGTKATVISAVGTLSKKSGGK